MGIPALLLGLFHWIGINHSCCLVLLLEVREPKVEVLLPILPRQNPSALTSAFIGGVIFNLSNLLIVAATAIAGMAVAFPIAVGLALVIGVVVNYIKELRSEIHICFLLVWH